MRKTTILGLLHPALGPQVQKGFSGSSPYWPTAATAARVTFDEYTVDLIDERALSPDIVQRRLTLSSAADGASPPRCVFVQLFLSGTFPPRRNRLFSAAC